MPTQQTDAKVTKLSGKAYAERNGTRIALIEGSDIFASDSITTDGTGAVEILFRDDSIIKLGPSSNVAVQDFVFDGESNPSFAVNLASGVMGYISGKVVEQNPAAFKINTPRATVGIRGTETYHSVSGESEVHAVVYISAGHIVLLTSSDGRVISLGSAMQAVTLHEGNAEPLTVRTFESSEMDKLQNALRDMRAPQEGDVQEGDRQEAKPQDQSSEESMHQQDAPATTSTVVQDEIRVVVVAEAGNTTLTELVQGALESLPGTTVDTLLPSFEAVQTLSETAQAQSSVLPEVTVTPRGDTIHSGADDAPVQPNTPVQPVIPEVPVIPETPGQPGEPVLPPSNDYVRAELTETLTGGAGNDTFTIDTMKGRGRIEAQGGDDVMRIGASTPDGGITPSVDGGEGVDTLELGSLNPAGNSIDVIRVEHIYGGSYNDTITLGDDTFAGTVETGTGDDSLTITGTLTGGHIDLGAGNDTLTVAGSTTGGTIDLGDGENSINITGTMAGSAIITGAGADVLTVTGSMSRGDINLGAGNNTVNITGISTGTGSITTGTGNDSLTISGTLSGTNSINLGDGANTVEITSTGTMAGGALVAGAGADVLTIAGTMSGGTTYLGAGNNTIDITGTITGGTITTGAGADVLTIAGTMSGGTTYLGAGADVVTVSGALSDCEIHLGEGNDVVTITGTMTGGRINLDAGDDTITIATSHGGTVDGGAGTDVLHLGDQPNDLSVTNVEMIYGGSAGDTITLLDAAFAGIVETQAGDDSLTISGTLTGGTIDLGAGNDVVTIAGNMASGTIGLGAGNDSLTIAGTMTSGTIDLGGGDDVVTISGNMANGTIDLGAGDDSLTITGTLSAGTIISGSGKNLISIGLQTARAVGVIDGRGGDNTIRIVDWEDQAELRVTLDLKDGSNAGDFLQLLGGTPNEGGLGIDGNWTQFYRTANSDRLSVTFEGISTQDEYNALASQITFSL